MTIQKIQDSLTLNDLTLVADICQLLQTLNDDSHDEISLDDEKIEIENDQEVIEIMF
jgi:hypothetical protein